MSHKRTLLVWERHEWLAGLLRQGKAFPGKTFQVLKQNEEKALIGQAPSAVAQEEAEKVLGKLEE